MGEVVVVDGQVNREKLSELLHIGAEHQELDFKSTLDLSSGPSKANVDFVKDCLAMASLPDGGYLVIGVDEDGTAATDQARINASHFDSKILADKVAGYIDDHLAIVSAVLDIDSDAGPWEVALIYVPPSSSGFPVVASRDGSYQREGKLRTVFRRGDIVVREGTGSTPLAQRHWPRLLQRHTERVKAETRADMDALLQALTGSLGSSPTRSDAALPPLLEMDNTSFASTLRNASGRQIRQVLKKAASVARGAAADKVADPLDKMTLVGVFAVQDRRPKLLQATIDAFWSVYETAHRPSVFPAQLRESRDIETATLWRDILTRVISIGAFAVRTKQWWALPTLVLVAFDEDRGNRFTSWLRHGLVYAARANVLTTEQGEPSGLILSRARQYLVSHPLARPDVPVFGDGSLEGLPPTQADSLLNSICQFDYLWNLMAALRGSDDPGIAFYTSWAAFEFARTRPMMDEVLHNSVLRDAVAGEADDAELAKAMDSVQSMGLSETVRLRGTSSAGP